MRSPIGLGAVAGALVGALLAELAGAVWADQVVVSAAAIGAVVGLAVGGGNRREMFAARALVAACAVLMAVNARDALGASLRLALVAAALAVIAGGVRGPRARRH